MRINILKSLDTKVCLSRAGCGTRSNILWTGLFLETNWSNMSKE